jgi:hypothetical protein
LGDTAGALDTLAATSRALDPQKPRIVKNTAAEAHPQIPQLWNMRGNSRIQLKNGRLIDMITGAWAENFPRLVQKKDSTHIENSRCPKNSHGLNWCVVISPIQMATACGMFRYIPITHWSKIIV